MYQLVYESMRLRGQYLSAIARKLPHSGNQLPEADKAAESSKPELSWTAESSNGRRADSSNADISKAAGSYPSEPAYQLDAIAVESSAATHGRGADADAFMRPSGAESSGSVPSKAAESSYELSLACILVRALSYVTNV